MPKETGHMRPLSSPAMSILRLPIPVPRRSSHLSYAVAGSGSRTGAGAWRSPPRPGGDRVRRVGRFERAGLRDAAPAARRLSPESRAVPRAHRGPEGARRRVELCGTSIRRVRSSCSRTPTRCEADRRRLRVADARRLLAARGDAPAHDRALRGDGRVRARLRVARRLPDRRERRADDRSRRSAASRRPRPSARISTAVSSTSRCRTTSPMARRWTRPRRS